MSAYDYTIPACNLPLPPEEAEHLDTLQQSALTFNPSPSLEEAKEFSIKAPDNQAELMHWYYCLGHLVFKKIQQPACHGKNPMRLANVHALRCASCLFGAMTKALWRGKECKNKHTVFTATKPGECFSIDHLQSTEPGLFGQTKGTLTKTHYKNAMIFVNHDSSLQFVYLMTSNLTSFENN